MKEAVEKYANDNKKIEYLNGVKEKLVEKAKQYNTIFPEEMQKRAASISNKYHKIKNKSGGHQHASSSSVKAQSLTENKTTLLSLL